MAEGGGFQAERRGRISIDQWRIFAISHRESGNVSQAARNAGISVKTAYRALADESHFPLYRKAREIAKSLVPEGVKDYEMLGVEAALAVADFAYFRERYFGRVATPWATHTAKEITRLLATPHKEFVLVNEPPGVGKSTFWTLDLPAWLICRDRAIRIQIGSSAQSTAQNYTQQLRREFERVVPLEASDDDKQKGLALDAVACLSDDFGVFRPPRGELWTAEAFVVKQLGDHAKGDREPTVRSLGRDTKFLGNRCKVALWDDLVDERNTKTAEARDDMKVWFPKYAESRVEPGGVIVLQGQRLHPDDLYAWAADVKVTEFGEDPDDESWGVPVGIRPQYVHIKYKAHYDDLCRGEHNPRTARPYDPEKPDDSGCLLDPRRLTYRDCMMVKDKDRRLWTISYQQEDIDPQSVLVNPVWIDGGRDPETGEEFIGCWNRDRSMASICDERGDLRSALPPGLSPPWLSVITADPSPTKYWSIQWWLIHYGTQRRFLIDHARRVMGANDFLDYLIYEQRHDGLLEEWHDRSKRLGAPISHVVVEQNAAQRFLLQSDTVRTWGQTRNVIFVPHDTYQNKTSPEFGVQALIPQTYRFGMVDLPAGDSTSKGRSMALRNEVTTYTTAREATTTDCLMAQWFMEITYPRLRSALEKPAQPPVMTHRVMPDSAFGAWARTPV
jgi:hypothetical protein